MKYIGNFAKNVPSIIVETLHNSKKKKHKFIESDFLEPDTQIWVNSGYNLSNVTWTSYDDERYKNVINLPSCFGTVLEIWFTKLDPGDMIPAHQDVYTYSSSDNLDRYCMMLQDFEIGHVFVCDNTHLEGYKFGDTYKLDESLSWHGACNIGLTPRLTMQIVSQKNR